VTTGAADPARVSRAALDVLLDGIVEEAPDAVPNVDTHPSETGPPTDQVAVGPMNIVQRRRTFPVSSSPSGHPERAVACEANVGVA
jgi:hypothetical protein